MLNDLSLLGFLQNCGAKIQLHVRIGQSIFVYFTVHTKVNTVGFSAACNLLPTTLIVALV